MSQSVGCIVGEGVDGERAGVAGKVGEGGVFGGDGRGDRG